MKIEDITGNDRNLYEAPVGWKERSLTKMGTKVPFGGDYREKAKGRARSNAAANQLWKYYQQQLGASNEKPSVDNIINFFEQYDVPIESIVYPALKSVGIDVKKIKREKEKISRDRDEAEKMNREFDKDNQKTSYEKKLAAQSKSVHEDSQQDEVMIDNPEKVKKVFLDVVRKHKPFHVQDANPKIPSELIDQIKKLKPKQKNMLAQVLNNQVKLKK